MAGEWKGSKATKAKAWVQANYGWNCWLCSKPIEPDDYTVDHVVPRSVDPSLTWVTSNWRPAHGRKHPEFNCPGNFGRGIGGHRKRPWVASGW